MPYEEPPENDEYDHPAAENMQNTAQSSDNQASEADDFSNYDYDFDILSELDVTDDEVTSSSSPSLCINEASPAVSDAEDPPDQRIRHNEACSWETFLEIEEPREGLYEYIDGHILYCPPDDEEHNKLVESYQPILKSSRCLYVRPRPSLEIIDEYEDERPATDNNDCETTSNGKSSPALSSSSNSTISSKHRGLCRPDLVIGWAYAAGSPVDIMDLFGVDDTSSSDTDSSSPLSYISSSDSERPSSGSDSSSSHNSISSSDSSISSSDSSISSSDSSISSSDNSISSSDNSISSSDNSISSSDNSNASPNSSNPLSDSDNPSSYDEGSTADNRRSEHDSDGSFSDDHSSLRNTSRSSAVVNSDSKISGRVISYPYNGMVSAVIEITSKSSREHDLYTKWTAYARSQVPLYIIMDRETTSNEASRIIVGSLEKFSNAEPSSNGDPFSQVVASGDYSQSQDENMAPSSSQAPVYYRKVYEPNEIVDCQFFLNLNMTARQLLESEEIGVLAQKMYMDRESLIERSLTRFEGIQLRAKEYRRRACELKYRSLECRARSHEADQAVQEYTSRDLEFDARLYEMETRENESKARALEEKSRADKVEEPGDRTERERERAERDKDTLEFHADKEEMRADTVESYTDHIEADEHIGRSRHDEKKERRDRREQRHDRKEEIQDYKEEREDDMDSVTERTLEMSERAAIRAERVTERHERCEARLDRARIRLKRAKVLLKNSKGRLKRAKARKKRADFRKDSAEARSLTARERLRKAQRRRRKNDKTLQTMEKYVLPRQEQGLKFDDSDRDTNSSSEASPPKRKLRR